MLKFLARIAMFFLGMALAADVFLPLRVEHLNVDQHSSSVDHSMAKDSSNRLADTSYTLHFVGGIPASCSVGYAAYTAVQDGDAVSVRSTKILRNCVQIEKGNDVIFGDKSWKLWELFWACLLIAAAIGWLEANDDGSIRIF